MTWHLILEKSLNFIYKIQQLLDKHISLSCDGEKVMGCCMFLMLFLLIDMIAQAVLWASSFHRRRKTIQVSVSEMKKQNQEEKEAIR